MVTPFQRPSLHLFATTAHVAAALSRGIELFAGNRLPHRFGPDSIHVVNTVLDVRDVLDRMNWSALRHAACVVDLSGGATRELFSEPVKEQRLQPLTLPLLYPEVFWIFVVEIEPAHAWAPERPATRLHWCRF